MATFKKESGARRELVLAKREAPEKREVIPPTWANEDEETPIAFQLRGDIREAMEGRVSPQRPQMTPRDLESIRVARVRAEEPVVVPAKQISQGGWGCQGAQDGREQVRANLVVIPRRPGVGLYIAAGEQRQWRGVIWVRRKGEP